MKNFLNIAIGMIIVAVLAGVGIILYTASQEKHSEYNTIAQWWTNAGQFIDYAGDTGVKDYTDVNYYIDYDKEVVVIGYGYVWLTYTFEELKQEETQANLKYIGITYDIKDTGDDFRLYWCNEELNKWYRDPRIG